MLSSKELCERTGVSRATLNNYIALGILPKPKLRPAEPGDGQARRLGYFPDESLAVIDKVRELKRAGKSMQDIADLIASGSPQLASYKTRRAAAGTGQDKVAANVTTLPTRRAGSGDAFRLSLDNVEGPAFMVNHRFQVEWCNEMATDILLDPELMASGEISERNVFRLILETLNIFDEDDVRPLLGFLINLASRRLSKSALLTLDPRLDDEQITLIAGLYDEIVADDKPSTPASVEISLTVKDGHPSLFRAYATHFREGIFFAFHPVDESEETLAAFLSRRDVVIRELLKHRRPYLTNMCVLVADLQESTKICAELPPIEYFELINQIWAEMEPVFRRYGATRGKHVGDGMVYYFFPQPDSHYTLNAVRCAFEMTAAIEQIDADWRRRKNWSNQLRLNIGLDEGQEWFGTYQTPTHIEFTVLGDTVNRAARISDLARDGSIWMTKSLVGTLGARDMGAIGYGVRHLGADGERRTVPQTFSRVSNLIDLDNPRYYKFSDIAVLPITELLSCSLADDNRKV
ncbi:MAG: adenylate/guanylate cyclase domain-containing protein [Rhodospirillales bacterium]